MSRAVNVSILAVVLAVLIGAGAYQMGIAQGLATSGQVAVPAGAPYYYHPGGFGFGFGFLGILFPILFFFLIFGLVGAAFRGGPRWGNGGPWMDRRTMLEEWHRQAHTEGTERRSDTGTPRRE